MPILGPEILVNPAMNGGSGWLATQGGAGAVTFQSDRTRLQRPAVGDQASIARNPGLNATIGKIYRLMVNSTPASGKLRMTYGGVATDLTAGGVKSWFITAVAATNAFFTAVDSYPSDHTIFDASIREYNPMALVTNGWWLTVTLRDSGGNPSNLTYDLVAATQANAITAAADIMTRLALVTKSAIAGYSLGERFQENAFVYPADAENENRAVITALLNGYANKPTTVIIPAPVDGIFVQPAGGPGYNIVEITNANLISYVDIWRVTGALAQISDGEYIQDSGSILKGKRTHRQSSNG